MPNPSLERDLHRHGTWPASPWFLSSLSRAKRHPGSSPSAQTLGPKSTDLKMAPVFPIVDRPEYSTPLYHHRQTGLIVPPATVELGTWKPAPNDCHANVSTWCKYMPEYSAVRGWLYFDFLDQLPYVLFNAHSVVRAPDGKLWDITPSQASQPYLFLAAEESEGEYAELIEGGISRLRHFK
jgi:hypothetical protein